MITVVMFARAPTIAFTTSPVFTKPIGIRLVIRMALRAMSLRCITRRHAIATLDVNALSYSLQMFWPHAVVVGAAPRFDVIPDQSFRRFTNEEVMRKDGFTVDTKSTIAVSVHAAEPKGTPIRPAGIDLRPEAQNAVGIAIQASASLFSRFRVVAGNKVRVHRVTSGDMRQAASTALPPSILLRSAVLS